MTLDELAVAAPRVSPAASPAWAWGCFRRRSIVYATGQEDVASLAVRLQAQGMAGVLRLPAWRPDVRHREGLHACTDEELSALCAAEGGVADSPWTDDVMAWENAASFQPYEKWPEPGRLLRVGPVLIETAPSGAYLQDWRLQPASGGLLAALRLMFETGLDGLTRPRDGGILICGEHCLFSLDRRRPLPAAGPAQQQMRLAGDVHAFADMVFDAETAYARRQADGGFRVELSTNPFHEGRTVPAADGFAQTSISEVLRQQVGEGPDRIVRQWRIDTLIADAAIGPVTELGKSAAAWLKREGKTLLRGL